MLIFLIHLSGYSQSEEVNQYDQDGKRHGAWMKHYENSDQIRYQGTFEHGKEVGVFKFYLPDSKDQPKATKEFSSENDSVQVTYFNSKGKVTSEGKMIGENREGKWKYYQKNQEDKLLMVENYSGDKLEGWKIVYFPNGEITEKTLYENGMKNGEQYIYSEEGQLLQHYHYKKDRLHGPSKVYNGYGELLSSGNYKNGLRDGEWTFYKEDQPDSTEVYPIKRNSDRHEE